jgi:hypothetical protein
MRTHGSRRLLALLVGATLVLAAAGTLWADSVVLEGNYLRVGVRESGALIDRLATAGIGFDPGGMHFYALDFLTPGFPFEFYSLRVGSDWLSSAVWEMPPLTANPFGLTTTQTDARSALSQGTWAPHSLGISQQVSFGENDSAVHFTVRLTNNGQMPLQGLSYARGCDPDPDIIGFGSGVTSNGTAAGRAWAQGPLSGFTLSMIDRSGGGVAASYGDWNQDPQVLLNPHNDGLGDYPISLAWRLPDLDPGQSATLAFDYVADPPAAAPEPATLLLAGLGLIGLGAFRRRHSAAGR